MLGNKTTEYDIEYLYHFEDINHIQICISVSCFDLIHAGVKSNSQLNRTKQRPFVGSLNDARLTSEKNIKRNKENEGIPRKERKDDCMEESTLYRAINLSADKKTDEEIKYTNTWEMNSGSKNTTTCWQPTSDLHYFLTL